MRRPSTLAWLLGCALACACARPPPAPAMTRLVDELSRAVELPPVPAPERLFHLAAVPAPEPGTVTVVVAPVEPRRFFVARAQVRRQPQGVPLLELRALTRQEAAALAPGAHSLSGPLPGEVLGECVPAEGPPTEWASCQRLERLPAARTAVLWVVPGGPELAREFELHDAQLPDERAQPGAVSGALVRYSPGYQGTGMSWRRALVARPGGRYAFELNLPQSPELWLALGHEQGSAGGAVRFVISQDGTPLLDVVRAPSQRSWGELRLKLAPTRGKSRLTFEAFAVEGEAGVPRGLWANPRVVGALEAPNVLLITADALRPDHLSAYGYSRDTSPTLEKLAQEGVRFERAIAQGDSTWTSLMALLTGRYAAHSGVVARGDRPGLSVPMLPELLARRGYDTFAGTDLGTFPPQYLSGFDDAERAYNVDGKISALPQLAAVVERMKAHPTFAWVHLEHPHYPLLPTQPERYAPGYQGRFAREFTTADHDRFRAVGELTAEQHGHITDLYDAAVRDFDEEVRRLLEQLAAADLLDKTVILVTADHGELLHEHGVTLDHVLPFDAVLHVPLVAVWEGHWPRGKVVSEPVQLIDLAPTLLRLGEGPSAPQLDGLDLDGPMRGEALPARAVYAGGGAGATVTQYWQGTQLVYVPPGLRQQSMGPAEIRFEEFQLFEPGTAGAPERQLTDAGVLLETQRARLAAQLEAWRAESTGAAGRGRLSQASTDALRQAGYLQGHPAPSN